MTDDPRAFAKLESFLERLCGLGVSFTLHHIREGSIMVVAVVPGERWEIEFFRDGDVEVERFISTGSIEPEQSLNGLFSRYQE